MARLWFRLGFLAGLAAFGWMAPAATYYVSSSGGNDANDGLAQNRAFATVARVNALALVPGDEVLFRCGDIWRGEMLHIVHSGAPGNPIRFGSYPAGCGDKPILSGAFPVSGWTLSSPNIYVADLDLGANAGLFPFGMNQLFLGGVRQAPGRWPNADEGDGGYSIIEGQPASNRIQDNQLPAVNWTGGLVHIKGMRWYIVNRVVTQTSGAVLTLNEDAGCWANDCTDWGFFINGHPATLDREGEWYYEQATNRVFLYSATAPTGVEASAIAVNNDVFRGGITLGRHLQEHISHVIIENFEISKWDMNGISTPTNLETHDPFNLTIRDNHIKDVDATGLNLQTWVWNATVGPNGWRGGHDLLVENNLIEGANHFGINSFAYDSEFRGNSLRDIGLINQAGLTGLGCGNDTFGGFCTEYGDGFRIKIDQPDYSGFGNLVICNRLERIGHNGIDIFGGDNTITQNLISEACFSKGDCGAIRTFGTGNLSTTNVVDIVISNNLILDVIGNTDGNEPFFQDLFGMGLYIDNFSANVTASGNTIVDATIEGILYQNSTGTASGNTLFGNNRGTMFRGQLGLAGGPTQVEVQQNIFYGRQASARTLTSENMAYFTGSNFNYFFNPYQDANIGVSGLQTLESWRTLSGMDAQSSKNWFQLNPGDPPLAEIFYNDGKDDLTVNLGASVYLDLDQNTVTGSFVLQPFTSRVLVPQFICNPTAEVSGDTTICAGGNAELSVALTGTGPWEVTWSDGLVQSNITQSPATRMVSPAQSTVYTVESFSDSLCNGLQITGRAAVLVGDGSPLRIDPPAQAQGLDPLDFTARIPCISPTFGWEWFHQGNSLGVDINPLTLGTLPAGVHSLEVHVDQGGPLQMAAARVLVAHHQGVNFDLNGDGCNTLADIHFLAPTWLSASGTDPTDDGLVNVLDFLFIHVNGAPCPPPAAVAVD